MILKLRPVQYKYEANLRAPARTGYAPPTPTLYDQRDLTKRSSNVTTEKTKAPSVCCCSTSRGESLTAAAGREKQQRERQRHRELRLEARLAQSEDARIEMEAEAGRLQAFIDEMRGLGPLPLNTAAGESTAAE